MKNIYSNNFSIQYDPIGQCLSLLSAEAHPTKLIEFKLQMLKGMGFADASKWIGETVLLLIPELRVNFLSQTRDPQSPIDFINEIAELMEKQKTDSPNSLYELAMLYVVRNRINAAKEDLPRADALLHQAAALGSEAAVKSLEGDWQEFLREAGENSGDK